ncbi:fusarisetin A cluster transcription factor fsa6 [Colletotrichum spaethianum]|uniref:Fusarisetin A cluster transcription factor fsa6 n=1 Tax=Colletotrichum spaethianum TaxID=700344 RepID=A0AA37P8T3_9PEZI|nr:fusarisetin A cluster transcription factor fsa6 [Colletotrichum spaethianum]GKT47765.1 fusarisetin A cluster transcription factor fsa6 [Colletotrichum spaethianum]
MAQSALSTTGTFSQGRDNVEPTLAARLSASRRRDKPQLSCGLCRRRKTRCDRQQPCATCSLRGHPCVYLANQTSGVISRQTAGDTASLQDRITDLERLVLTLSSLPMKPKINTVGVTSIPSPTNNGDTVFDDRLETGSMRVSASKHQYVGSDHWAAILDSIADLKNHFDREEHLMLAESPIQSLDGDSNEDGVFGPQHPSQRALLLYGCRPASSMAEILSGLPPKSAVDRYVERYFSRLDLVASSSVHGPSFIEEYDKFWTDPESVPIMWVGLLYSMLCLAIVASDPASHRSEQKQQQLQIDLYREKLVQCLMMGEYTQGGQHALETFTNYVYIEFRIRDDAEKDVWFLLGLEVNLAKRMGYHRDPKHFNDINPLQGEMRRRVWATILLGDILISGQMGMPRMIRDHEFDTAEPRNLNDEDLNRSMVVIPKSRPETEHTTALGIIARRRILIALGTISDLTASLVPCSYAEIMRVDAILHKARMSIPPALQMKSMAASVTDSPQTIMARIFLSHMFYKGQIMLHRRFLFAETASQPRDTFSYSRNTCLEASLAMLHIQKVLDEETCPGGLLRMMHWRVGSIMNHQFLTATMILCSLVHRKHILNRAGEIISALRTARSIWMRRGDGSREAKKATQAVSIVLAQAGGPRFDTNLFVERDNFVAVSNNGTDNGHLTSSNKVHEEIGFDEMETIFFVETFGLDHGKRIDDIIK